jgi:hypothetical protein
VTWEFVFTITSTRKPSEFASPMIPPTSQAARGASMPPRKGMIIGGGVRATWPIIATTGFFCIPGMKNSSAETPIARGPQRLRVEGDLRQGADVLGDVGTSCRPAKGVQQPRSSRGVGTTGLLGRPRFGRARCLGRFGVDVGDGRLVDGRPVAPASLGAIGALGASHGSSCWSIGPSGRPLLFARDAEPWGARGGVNGGGDGCGGCQALRPIGISAR